MLPTCDGAVADRARLPEATVIESSGIPVLNNALSAKLTPINRSIQRKVPGIASTCSRRTSTGPSLREHAPKATQERTCACTSSQARAMVRCGERVSAASGLHTGGLHGVDGLGLLPPREVAGLEGQTRDRLPGALHSHKAQHRTRRGPGDRARAGHAHRLGLARRRVLHGSARAVIAGGTRHARRARQPGCRDRAGSRPDPEASLTSKPPPPASPS